MPEDESDVGEAPDELGVGNEAARLLSGEFDDLYCHVSREPLILETLVGDRRSEEHY